MPRSFTAAAPLIFIAILFFCCRKGDPGAAGPAGSNGFSLLNGKGAPSDSTGIDGDFYLDTDGQFLYGPKKAGNWGEAVLLKGNANIITDTFSVPGAAWRYGDLYYAATAPQISTGFVSRSFIHFQPAITQELLNTGMLQVYFTSAPDLNADNWTALPFYFISYGGYAFNYVSETAVGTITLYFYFSRISADPPDLQTFPIPEFKFKLVLLSGKLIAEKRRPVHSAFTVTDN